jgi:uncharacterized repeat protein (TIGR03803 family)
MGGETGSRRFRLYLSWSRSTALGAAILIGAASTTTAIAAPAATTKVAYSFAGGADGEYSSTDLIVDGAGNLYGTTVIGGNGGGTAFELSPTATGWKHKVLYAFTGGSDGGEPYGGVTSDGQGNLYGTAVVGGTGGSCVESGCGVVFKLSKSGGKWSQSVIYNFQGGKDGYGPGGGLTLGKDGSLFGMTPTGGAHGFGVVFKLMPGPGSGAWSLTVIHAFSGGLDGGTGSAGRLLLDPSGALYGVATVGGAHQEGVAFKLHADSTGLWRFTTIYAFRGQPDAGFPYGGLVSDPAGNLYGTTYYDGANDLGSVYELTHAASSGWTERALYSFKGGRDGEKSISTLVRDTAGNLYGTTSEGGAGGCGCGTIFKLAPRPNGTWTESVAHRFAGQPGDGAFAYNGMAAGPGGHFYGATVHGGSSDDGVIYQFTP